MSTTILICAVCYLYIIGFRDNYEISALIYESEGHETPADLAAARMSALTFATFWPVMPVIELVSAILSLFWVRR